ncbi:MAG TPA: cell wall hydrolase, partial [Clostridia bacterium]|nr:cell wall hydrolase [Clostridia bacterium]
FFVYYFKIMECLRLRRTITSILAIIILLTPLMSIDVSANAEISPNGISYWVTNSPVIYDYKNINFTNDKLIVGGYMVLPVTEFFDYFGYYQYEWNNETKSVTITDGYNTYVIYSGTSYLLKNGIMIQAPATSLIYNGKIYASLKVMADALGLKTLYDEVSDSILLTTNTFFFNSSYTYEDVYWLSRIVYAEAGYESYEGMVAVANVVLNRVRHDDFPDTIYGVIFDKAGGTQFTPVSAGTIYNEPSENAILAAKAALNGYNNISWCLFFFNPRIAKSTWIADSCDFYGSIGNHDFYF